MKLNDQVRAFWEKEACGTGKNITEDKDKYSFEWYEKIEAHRYKVEPMIHSAAQFTRYNGKKVLEVGVGAGTDHLQWARAGAECYGVDLTEAAIETTRNRLAKYGFKSNLQRADAEKLPFEDNTFDVVYSWGVIHHSENPEKIVGEIRRVLKPGGRFIGMIYHRRSLVALQTWVRGGVLKLKPWISFKEALWNNMESIGTKAYTVDEAKKMFAAFKECDIHPVLTVYDCKRQPKWITSHYPDSWGWYMIIDVVK